jgi:hypothetical protein
MFFIVHTSFAWRKTLSRDSSIPRRVDLLQERPSSALSGGKQEYLPSYAAQTSEQQSHQRRVDQQFAGMRLR